MSYEREEAEAFDRSMMYLFFLVVALVGLGAFSCLGSHTLDDVAPQDALGALVIDSSGTTEMVASSDRCTELACYAFRRWRRITDTAGDVRWLVSTSGSACLINDAQFAVALGWRGKQVRCYWRQARG